MPVLTKSGLLLPNEGAAQGMDTIYVPASAIKKMWTCEVPTEAGTKCGAQFEMDEMDRFTRHVLRCKERHEEVIAAMSPRQRMKILDPNGWDPEVETHMRTLGRRMRRERRMTVKPSERAGF